MGEGGVRQDDSCWLELSLGGLSFSSASPSPSLTPSSMIVVADLSAQFITRQSLIDSSFLLPHHIGRNIRGDRLEVLLTRVFGCVSLTVMLIPCYGFIRRNGAGLLGYEMWYHLSYLRRVALSSVDSNCCSVGSRPIRISHFPGQSNKSWAMFTGCRESQRSSSDAWAGPSDWRMLSRWLASRVGLGMGIRMTVSCSEFVERLLVIIGSIL